MKSTRLKIITFASAMLFSLNSTFAQKAPALETDPAIKGISLENYESFKKSVKPLINQMSAKRIIGLGEGTHGTAEFYKVRFWISRILIEEKGYNHITFENDLGDTWFLNDSLSKTSDLNALMRNHMMSIWQNEETKAMLSWVKDYNSKHKRKVSINGMDYPLLKPDVNMLLTLLKQTNNQNLTTKVEGLLMPASKQDEAWVGMNDKNYKGDYKTMEAGSKKGYKTADSIEKEIKVLSIDPTLKSECLKAIANLKQGFEPFYFPIDESARDSIMAHNVSLMLKEPKDKMIIWAHNAHMAKTGIYDNAVGGTGGKILKLFPNNYFVLGTLTANGSFAGTIDRRPTNSNPMKAYPLEAPIKNSWEELLSTKKAENFYFNPAELNKANEIKPFRVIGFGIKSGASTYDNTNLINLFDALLFIKNTNAPTPLK